MTAEFDFGSRERPIKHLMVNTNGIRIAQDEEFARRLAAYRPGFEVYLQFDSLEDDAVTVRDRDTTEQRRVPVADLVADLRSRMDAART